MIPWSVLDTATIDGGGELRLKQRGSEFSIMLGSTELMNSRLSGSEKALASESCARIRHHPQPRVLIGGLGMGFTLRAALAQLGSDAQITVVELVPAVIRWARGPMAEIHRESLDDRRVTVSEGDVSEFIRSGLSSYDAILLDVDNGPEGLTRKGNDELYGFDGLAAARTALRPGGVLAVWSSGPNEEFTRRLRRSGFSVDEVRVRARGAGGGARHVLWIAANTSAPPQPVRETRARRLHKSSQSGTS